MKTHSITTLILSVAISMSLLHAEGIMIDDFEHSNETGFGAIRTTRYGYVTVNDHADGMLTGFRAGYLLASRSAGGPGVGWDGHCLLYQGSAETNERHQKDGSALFSMSYNRRGSRGIPSTLVDFQGKNIEFSLAHQKRLEILFRECHLGESEKIDLYLRIGDSKANLHEIKMIKLPGSGSVSFPLAPFIAKGLDFEHIVGVEVLFGDSVSPGDGLPLGVDFKIEHIRTVDTDTLPDTDADGKTDLFERLTGGDPLDPSLQPNESPQSMSFDENGETTFSYRTLTTLPEGITSSVEISSDLTTWNHGEQHLDITSSTEAENGFRDIRVKPATNLPQAFFRVRIHKTITPIVR